MKLKADLFPYPVLTPDLDDYIDNTSFQVSNLEAHIEGSDLVSIRCIFEVHNKQLQRLLENKELVYALHLEGEASSYRKLITTFAENPFHNISIKNDVLPKKLFVNCLILANTTIKNYRNETFNSLYYDETYVVDTLYKGDIVAFLPTQTFEFDVYNEALGQDSIFIISKHNEPYMGLELTGDKIEIILPQNMFNTYKTWGNVRDKKSLFISSIIMPALIEALGEISNERVSPELQWVSSITYILERENIDLGNQSLFVVAQKLLQQPIDDVIQNEFNGENKDE